MFRFTIALSILFIWGCSDGSEELGNGYFLRIEGRSVDEVLNHKSKIRGIPPAVQRYNYDKTFIVGEQHPKRFDEVLDERITYPYGRDTIYYWIIIKESHTRLGPLTLPEFEEARKKYNVPNDLELKDVYD
jgi:hypothetical protein